MVIKIRIEVYIKSIEWNFNCVNVFVDKLIFNI